MRWQQREERDFGDYGGAVRDGAAQQSRISFGEPRLDVRHPAVLAGHVLAACAQKRTVLTNLFPAHDTNQGLRRNWRTRPWPLVLLLRLLSVALGRPHLITASP